MIAKVMMDAMQLFFKIDNSKSILEFSGSKLNLFHIKENGDFFIIMDQKLV